MGIKTVLWDLNLKAGRQKLKHVIYRKTKFLKTQCTQYFCTP